MKKVLIFFLTLLFTIGMLFGAFKLYSEHKENEMAAFHYAAVEVLKSYDESEPLFHGGTRYDFGQGRYMVIVKNQQGKKYYYEVLISDERALVEILDNTSYILSS